MGCAPSSYSGLGALRPGLRRPGHGGSAQDGHRDNEVRGPRRLSMRPHSLETRIVQVDQVDTVILDPVTHTELEAPFTDGQLGLGDLSPTLAAKLPKDAVFCDPTFPAFVALGSAEITGVRWCRPSELGEEGPVWTGESRGRVQAGEFDDRWLAEALAVAAQRPQILDKVFGVDEAETAAADLQGVVRVKLWRFGRWETVVVDDRLPVSHAICTDVDGEVWPALLEKAFAKIHGGYAGLAGGDVLWALEDLTGGVAQRLQVRTATTVGVEGRQDHGLQQQGAGEAAPPAAPRPSQRERDFFYVQVFRPLAQALRVGALVSCSPKRSQDQLARRQEIVVSLVVETNLTMAGPQVCVQDDVGSTPRRWLDLDDFVREYTNIIVTTLGKESEKLQVQEILGWWEAGVSAGGSRNNLEKFATNPQYSLTVAQPEEHEDNMDLGRCSLLLALMQEHRRSSQASRPPLLPIAYFIYKADVPNERLSAEYFLLVPEEVDTGPFRNKREVAQHAELEPGNYIVIPATWSAGQEGGFLLRIFTLRKVKLTALPPYKPMCAMLPTWVPATET